MKKSPKKSPLHNAPACPGTYLPRRQFIKQAALGSALLSSGTAGWTFENIKPINNTRPRKVTAIGQCKRYDYPQIKAELAAMFEQLGDVKKLVKNKHVTMKLNLVNTPKKTVGGLPLSYTVTVHPDVAMAAASLLSEYGAKKIIFCDQLPLRIDNKEAFSLYGFDIDEVRRQTGDKVVYENTRNLGSYKSYKWVDTPGGGLIAKAWEVNRAYTDTDVLVSVTKLKSHVSGGVTLGMKNLFGVPPSSMYGEDLEDHPDESAVGYRGAMMHSCVRKPLTSSPTFKDTTVEGDHGHNVPQFIADLNTAFPVELVVIDGVSTTQSGEGWWLGNMISPCNPGLLIAGRNPVCTDAVATAVMGFDPEAEHRTHPFANGLNHIKLASELGLGEHRLNNLDVAGLSIKNARFGFEPTYQRES